MKKRTKIQFTAKTGVICLGILFVLLYSIIYIVPKVSDIFTQTYSAQYGTLEASFDATCVIIRDEKVFKSTASGNVKKVAEEGDLIRAGRAVVTVGGSEQYTDMKGLVSYHYDGYESKYTPQNLDSLTKSFITAFKEEKGEVKSTAAGSAASGDVIFKIIDNKEWFLVCWIDKGQAESLSAGGAVQIKFDDETTVRATIDSINEQGSDYQMILSCNRNYDGFDEYRIKECTIVTSSNSGIILETDSIVEKDGTNGVYVVDKYGDANFVPISILSSSGDKTVVVKNYFYDSEGQSVTTVKSYDVVLKRGE